MARFVAELEAIQQQYDAAIEVARIEAAASVEVARLSAGRERPAANSTARAARRSGPPVLRGRSRRNVVGRISVAACAAGLGAVLELDAVDA